MMSIIIPVFNEEVSIGTLLTFLDSCKRTDDIEIIVVDGGSTDATAQIVKSFGARFFRSPKKGRAGQMNYGASHAKGKILYFLHADTLPPKSFIKNIEKAFFMGYQSGCFRLSFDIPDPILRLYSWFTRFDVDLFRFGDQGLFVEKKLFEQVQGFDEHLLVMEDQEIVKVLKKHSRFKVLQNRVVTSSRKYQKVGILKLQLIFLIIVVLYYSGVRQKTLAHFYREAIK